MMEKLEWNVAYTLEWRKSFVKVFTFVNTFARSDPDKYSRIAGGMVVSIAKYSKLVD